MNIFSGIADGISHFVHNLWPEHPCETLPISTEPAIEKKTPEAKKTVEPELSTLSTKKEEIKEPIADEGAPHEVPVRTVTGEHKHIPLPVLMNTFRLSTTDLYEQKSRSLYTEIEEISGKLKKLDSFLAAFSSQLCKEKSVNLRDEPFSKMAKELQEIGVVIPTDTSINVEQATSMLRSWEHSRDELDQGMKMKYHKFAEISKDREMMHQAFIAMETNHNDALKKICNGIK